MKDYLRVVTLFVCAVLGICSAYSHSSIITTGCVDVDVSCTLAELTGGASITIDDVVFASWNAQDASNVPVNIDNIIVRALDNQSSSVGLAFATNGSLGTTGFDLVDLLISFEAIDQSGIPRISNVSFELTDFFFGTSNAGGAIFGFEDLRDTARNIVGDMAVEADNFPPSVMNLVSSTAFSPMTTLSIEKLLLINGDAPDDEVVLNEFVQRFGLVSGPMPMPVPNTPLLLITGLLGLIWHRRKNRCASSTR